MNRLDLIKRAATKPFETVPVGREGSRRGSYARYGSVVGRRLLAEFKLRAKSRGLTLDEARAEADVSRCTMRSLAADKGVTLFTAQKLCKWLGRDLASLR